MTKEAIENKTLYTMLCIWDTAVESYFARLPNYIIQKYISSFDQTRLSRVSGTDSISRGRRFIGSSYRHYIN
jgi:hypothetical protein